MKFGIFLAPFHPTGQNPTLALERDLELICALDRLGYDEAWIGEHHSAGFEIIASPEVFIATAAERTRNIRLGTGVSSLPFHHPLVLTDRMVLLDHLTRGRVMFGVGPGSLPSDAYMMGIDVTSQRERMEESLEAIMALLTSDEPVTMTTDWFTLRDARLQLRPYTKPHLEVAVAAMVSPSGPRAAGRFGVSLLSVGATTQGGFNALETAWDIATERAAEYSNTVHREDWRLVGPMYIAETEEQARADVAHGLMDWVQYFEKVAALPLAPGIDDVDKLIDALNNAGLSVIGTPAMMRAQLERLTEQSGGFGTFLVMSTEWANRENTLRSYELFAREVMPHFQGSLVAPQRSRDWAAENRPAFMGEVGKAITKAVQDHYAEAAAKEAAARDAG